MFRVGQKVVCVDAVGSNELTEGSVYTVAYIGPYRSREWRGRVFMGVCIHLHEAKPNPEFDGFAPERFRPAVDRPTDISCFKSILRERELERVS